MSGLSQADSLDIRMLKGVVSKDHVHLHLSYPPKLSVSEIVKRIKGRMFACHEMIFRNRRIVTGGSIFGERGVQGILPMK